MRYKDKVTIVTGGSKGIGAGCVKVFVEHGGSKVVFCSRNESEGKAFEAYGMEQQGQIVEDSFRGDRAALAVSPFRPPSDFA